MELILTLGWIGLYAPLALGAIGSMIGCLRGGMAACGAMLEVERGYGRFAYIDTQAAGGLDIELLWNQR